MKSYKKTVIAILLAVVLCSMACIEVFADHYGYSGYTDSPQYVTRQWGRDETQNLTSQFANPDSGNVGVYFYVTSFCMPDGFVRNTNRTITIMLVFWLAFYLVVWECKNLFLFSVLFSVGCV